MLKSAAVVIGSYLLSVVLVLATGPLLSALFPDQFVTGRVRQIPRSQRARCFWDRVNRLPGLCARFAPGRPARHVLWFTLGEAMGIGAAIPNWSKGWPHWYWLSWLLTWPVSCYIGLLLATSRPHS